jgi:hypothetical protein
MLLNILAVFCAAVGGTALFRLAWEIANRFEEVPSLGMLLNVILSLSCSAVTYWGLNHLHLLHQ